MKKIILMEIVKNGKHIYIFNAGAMENSAFSFFLSIRVIQTQFVSIIKINRTLYNICI